MKFLNILFLLIFVFSSNAVFAEDDNEILNLYRLITSGTSSLEEISKEIEREYDPGPLKKNQTIKNKMLKIIESNINNPSALLDTKIELFNTINVWLKSLKSLESKKFNSMVKIERECK